MLSTLLFAALSMSPAGETAGKAFDALSALPSYSQAVVSPDGSRVAWVENFPSTDGTPLSGVYVAERAAGAAPRRVTAARGRKSFRERALAWAPDARRIAFLSDAEKPGQSQIYVADVSSGRRPKKLTSVSGDLAVPSWSPDGRRIAFLWTENASRAAGPLAPMTPAVGVIEESIEEQRLAVVGADGGVPRAISPPDLYVHEYDWSPDGRRFAAVAAPGAGDRNWYVSTLCILGDDGVRVIYRPALQIAVPRWSPDGSRIAFIEGLMSDEGSTGGEIFTTTPDGEAPRNLTPALAGSAASLTWSADSRTVLFGEILDGHSAWSRVDASGASPPEILWQGAEVVSAGGGVGFSVSRDGAVTAAVRSSAQDPPSVEAGPIGAWTRVTAAPPGAERFWGSCESTHWESDRYRVQGWLLLPRGEAPARGWPLVVAVHGGPASAVLPGWPSAWTAALTAGGFAVFLPNFRGSYGQGEDFTRANVKDLGHGDLRDILAGLDTVLAHNPIDRARVGIWGWSYGGYMTMWTVTQTQRFRAAVAGAGIVDWQSYAGQNDIDEWLIPYFGKSVYEDPEVYARSSPITFIRKVKTPTLVLVGERDGECPAPQSFEFWHALKSLGVATRLVVYPGEGHSIASKEHRRDIAVRLVSWFDEKMPAR